jgi:penicillin-binding protein 1A
VGRGRVISAARRAGLDGVEDVGPSLAFGVTSHTPWEVLAAYSTLSAGGRTAAPHLVASIETDRGQVLWRRRPIEGEQVFEERHTAALSHMLHSVVERGSGVHARIEGHQAAGKTGTAQDSRDAWFAGYASGVVGVVWMGHDDNSPMAGSGGVSGSGAPARVWKRAMTAALSGRPARPLLPYEPPAPERSLLEHLAGLLGLGDGQDQAAADPLAGLIEDVGG